MYLGSLLLTHKQLEMQGWILSTVATDVLVLKHHAISNHSTNHTSIALDNFPTKLLQWTTLEKKMKKYDPVV